MSFKPTWKWLFCGDSIVDGNRSRCGDPNHIMGHGFAFIAASYLGAEHPEKNIRTYNTARSGINSRRLLESWEQRVLSIKPDVLTLLVGINDTSTRFCGYAEPWHYSRAGVEAYAENIRYGLSLLRRDNPKAEILLGLPFFFPADNWTYTPENAIDQAERKFTVKIRDITEKHFAEKRSEVAERQEKVRRIAADFGAHILDFPAVFEQAQQLAPIEHWVWDRVHPSVAGHMLMFKEWLKVCREAGLLD